MPFPCCISGRARLPEFTSETWHRQSDPRGHGWNHCRTGLFDRPSKKFKTKSVALWSPSSSKDDGTRRRGKIVPHLIERYDHPFRHPRTGHRAAPGRGRSHQSQNRAVLHFGRSTYFAFSAKDGSRNAEDRGTRGPRLPADRQSRHLDSYLRWRGIEATLQLAQSNNSKVVIIGSAKDGLPIILGNSDTLPSSGAGQTAPKDDDRAAKETTAVASPAVWTTPAAAPTENLLTAGSGTPEAAAPDRPPSSWPLSLFDIEAFLARMVHSTDPKAEPLSKQQ